MSTQVMIAAMAIFSMGLIIAVSSKNILKILIGMIIMYSSSLLALGVRHNPENTVLLVILSAIAPIATFLGVFLVIRMYKKFNTLDITEIEKIMKEQI